jgi:hypothetical protein
MQLGTVTEDWLPMPDGKLYHRDCIHTFEEHFNVEDAPQCIHGVHEQPTESQVKSSSSYYSDWSVYAQQVTVGVTEMSNEWIVPPAPDASGPAGLGSVYVFNGLEDGGGQHGKSSYILQPVLQYGKSGCLNDPALWHEWHMTAYYVTGAGRAYCGKRLAVKEGDTVIGKMTLVGNNANSTDWTIEASVKNSEDISSYTAKNIPQPDAAYLTLEGMLIYHCTDYPPNGEITFTANSITQKGKEAGWTPEVRHSECGQAVQDDQDGTLKLTWNSTAK